MRLLEREAQRRANALTNKQLAQLTGLTPAYVAQVITRIRRKIEAETQRIDVSHETSHA